MDKLTPERRSENMRRIRSKGMKPEIAVRKLVYAMGYRYRLHERSLPGKPDIVFKGKKKAIFIHGCFWHQHSDSNCRISRIPKSNTDYWNNKLKANVERDSMVLSALNDAGWNVLTIWECQLKNMDSLREIVASFLSD